ncbi:hypothetical protein [Campylobacter sp. US33a]|uniref:hypothetical protein n=1 Tax=Campylobacter sp. US33a TaxID=2498120 RepID=UPI001068A9DE|nr:hypothetical protein [Campylobacter sp. US33a]TEY00726.1 hypothetical protein ELQ16_08815 [Campylobacter sp. US33a]
MKKIPMLIGLLMLISVDVFGCWSGCRDPMLPSDLSNSSTQKFNEFESKTQAKIEEINNIFAEAFVDSENSNLKELNILSSLKQNQVLNNSQIEFLLKQLNSLQNNINTLEAY